MLKKRQLLNDFENQLLSLEKHPLRMFAIAGESSIWVQYEISQYNSDLRQFEQLRTELEQLTASNKLTATEIDALLNDSRLTIDSYQRFTQGLWAELESVNDKRVARELTSEALAGNHANQLSTQFENLFEDLTRFQQTIDQRYEQATAQLQRAEQLRLIIIVTSMVLSVGLAVILAVLTSRTIARPIEQLTTVARRVTQDNNFQLQAEIKTQDEVALLAKALNQLVSWTGQYTRELNDARQNLEQRVEERTIALQQSEASLRQKADDLQQAMVELQQTQLQLVQSEKMSSLGQMVAGIAHEINNPINFIYANLPHVDNYSQDLLSLAHRCRADDLSDSSALSMLQTQVADMDLDFMTEDLPKMLTSMRFGAERIRHIVLSLRNFSRLDESDEKAVDLHEGIDSALLILGHRLKANSDCPNIEVIKDFGELPLVKCYPAQLNQVYMNVLVNAIEALETAVMAGKIGAEGVADGVRSQSPKIWISTQLSAQGQVEICIRDNGIGIDKEIQNKVFDHFFTTKSPGQGIGLGLAVARQIVVDHHGGTLCLQQSEQDTQFVITL